LRPDLSDNIFDLKGMAHESTPRFIPRQEGREIFPPEADTLGLDQKPAAARTVCVTDRTVGHKLHLGPRLKGVLDRHALLERRDPRPSMFSRSPKITAKVSISDTPTIAVPLAIDPRR
jgi:hypothetical protein